MQNLQETFNRLYEQQQQKRKQSPKLNIRGVIITQKEMAQLSTKAKAQMFLVS